MAGAAPKKAAMLIALGGLKKPKSETSDDFEEEADDESADEPDSSTLKSEAAADAMAAFKGDDVAALEEALSRFVEACKSEGY